MSELRQIILRLMWRVYPFAWLTAAIVRGLSTITAWLEDENYCSYLTCDPKDEAQPLVGVPGTPVTIGTIGTIGVVGGCGGGCGGCGGVDRARRIGGIRPSLSAPSPGSARSKNPPHPNPAAFICETESVSEMPAIAEARRSTIRYSLFAIRYAPAKRLMDFPAKFWSTRPSQFRELKSTE